MNQMNVWGMTDIGLVRKENQDAYVTAQHTASGRTVGVVCDGMGGPAGGRVASQIAVSVYLEELEKLLTADQTPQQLLEASAQAAALANQAIQAEAERREECRNMGTTLVSAISYDGGVVVTNVGDSRAYHITEDGITRITKDHSLVESMVDRGDITAEEARRHPSRNLITRALGPDISADCDGYICPMNAGEYLLLCSDGLVNTVSDQEMLFEVLHDGDVNECLGHLPGPAAGHRQAPGRAGQCHGRPDAKTVKGGDTWNTRTRILEKCWTTAMRFWSVSAPGAWRLCTRPSATG